MKPSIAVAAIVLCFAVGKHDITKKIFQKYFYLINFRLINYNNFCINSSDCQNIPSDGRATILRILDSRCDIQRSNVLLVLRSSQ
jgi:hypothetical protein